LDWCDNEASPDSSEGFCAYHLAKIKEANNQRKIRRRWRDALELDPDMDGAWLDAPDA
jgi:hypothetical protein